MSVKHLVITPRQEGKSSMAAKEIMRNQDALDAMSYTLYPTHNGIQEAINKMARHAANYGIGSAWIGMDLAQEKPMKTATQWSFKSTHKQDIDFTDIADSLTRQHPLALVHGTVDWPTKDQTKNECYVVLHESLVRKAATCRTMRGETSLCYWDVAPSLLGRIQRNIKRDIEVIQLNDVKDFAIWQAWAKEVRAARWPEDGRGKTTFQVNLVTL